MLDILEPKKPIAGSRWKFSTSHRDEHGYRQDYYSHPDGFTAISALEVATGILRNKAIPQYHLSIAKVPGRRCSSQDAKFILKQFGMSDALEDNHVPFGFSRNFWLPVDESKIGIECSCVEDEPAIVEDKGDFVWRPDSH